MHSLLLATLDNPESHLLTVFSMNTSDSHLPCIEPPNKHLETAAPDSKAATKEHADLSLPPIHFNQSAAAAAATSITKSTTQEPDHNSFPEPPLKKSDLTQILEAAKKIRDEKIAASLGLDRFNRVKKLPRKVAVSRVANFTSPRASLTNYKNRYAAAVQQQTVDFQPDPSTVTYTAGPKTQGEATTEVIDLESGGEAAVMEGFDPQLKSTSLVSLRGQKTRSQTHLITSPPSTKADDCTKPARNQRLRRSRSHARIGSHPFAKQAEKTVGQSKSVSLEDMPNKVRASTPALKREQRAIFERRNATTSKPIVRKPVFVKQAVPKLNLKQTNAVYGTRPYVIPMARRVGQQGSSPQRRQGLAGNKNPKKRMPLDPYPRLKRKHQRQELSMPRGKQSSYNLSSILTFVYFFLHSEAWRIICVPVTVSQFSRQTE